MEIENDNNLMPPLMTDAEISIQDRLKRKAEECTKYAMLASRIAERKTCSPYKVIYPITKNDLERYSGNDYTEESYEIRALSSLDFKWCINCGLIYFNSTKILDDTKCCKEMTLCVPEPKPSEINFGYYHGGCMDGLGGAWAIHRFFCKLKGHGSSYSDVALFPAKHETKSEKLGTIVASCKNRNVVIVDFAFDKKCTLEIKKVCNKFILLDHHNSNKGMLSSEPNCYFDMEHSGAYLAWAYMVKSIPLVIPTEIKPPKIIEYIQDRDLWQFKLEDSREISTALMVHTSGGMIDFDSIDNDEDSMLKSLADKGKHYMVVRDFNINGGNIKGTISFIFMGLRAVAISTSYPPSEVAEAILKAPKFKNHRIVLVITIKLGLKVIKVNLRSRETDTDIDVGYIAKKYWDGGGHPQAAGFSIPDSKSVNYIFERYPEKNNNYVINYKYKEDTKDQDNTTPQMDELAAMIRMNMHLV